jgi:hypothetical protein
MILEQLKTVSDDASLQPNSHATEADHSLATESRPNAYIYSQATKKIMIPQTYSLMFTVNWEHKLQYIRGRNKTQDMDKLKEHMQLNQQKHQCKH